MTVTTRWDMRRYVAGERFGTALLVFVGAGSIMTDVLVGAHALGTDRHCLSFLSGDCGIGGMLRSLEAVRISIRL